MMHLLSESIYFYAITGLLALSGLTFLILRYTPSIRFEYEETHIDTAEEEGHTQVCAVTIELAVFVYSIFLDSAQDRSPFCIFHIMNGISQHPDLMDTFLVGNHFHIFWEDYQIKCSQHFKQH